ncbi:MAG: iron-sulfur cluster assembly scaffold protein [Pseudomonadota bacterium]
MINDVYNARILEYAGNIPLTDRLEAPEATAKAHSKLCGSTVTVDINLDGDTIADYAHDVKACALGQASSSIVATKVIGATTQEVRDARDAMYKMLKEEGLVPSGRFEDLKYFEPVRDYKARHASILLVFDALDSAISEIEAKRQNDAA